MTGSGTAAELPGVILSNGSQPVGSFRERVEAAREAGFTAIGLSYWSYRELLAAGLSNAAMSGLLRDNGIRIAELEVALGIDADRGGWGGVAPRWGPDWLDVAASYADASVERDLFAMADAFGARHLVAVGSWGGPVDVGPVDIGTAASAFGGFCDRAADHGLAVALEFVPGTSIPDAATALQVISGAGRPNGGICFDSWHYKQGPDDPDVIDRVPPDKITVLQLADGTRARAGGRVSADDYFRATMNDRKLPGAGDFDLAGLLRRVWRAGGRPPISIEVLSSDLPAMGVSAGARAIARATRDLLADAAISAGHNQHIKRG